METLIKGSVFKIGDDINTDIIIPGGYLIYTELEDLAKYAFEPLGEEFRQEMRKHDILVVGHNFGCGSAREQGATAIKAMGIKAVVGKSFARIFYRNAINTGLPAIESPQIYDLVENGDAISIDLEKNKLTVKSQEIPFPPIPPVVFQILSGGGLFEYLKMKVKEGSA